MFTNCWNRFTALEILGPSGARFLVGDPSYQLFGPSGRPFEHVDLDYGDQDDGDHLNLCHVDNGDQAPAGSIIFNPLFPGQYFAKSQEPQIFGTGFVCIFHSGILPKKYGIFRDFLLSS